MVGVVFLFKYRNRIRGLLRPRVRRNSFKSRDRLLKLWSLEQDNFFRAPPVAVEKKAAQSISTLGQDKNSVNKKVYTVFIFSATEKIALTSNEHLMKIPKKLVLWFYLRDFHWHET